MSPHLVSKDQGPTIPLEKPIIVVGRQQECDIQIASRKISRKHCCIAQVNDHLVVRDLFSTNGIRINGVKVMEGCLRDGDELTIGNLSFEVRFTVREESRKNGEGSHAESIQSWEQPRPIPEPSGVSSADIPVANAAPRPPTPLSDVSLIPGDIKLVDDEKGS